MTLSHLANLCLGRKIDKSNQLSNWLNRPLRHEQIQYAALDAHCLIEIFDIIRNECTRCGLNYKDFLLKRMDSVGATKPK